MQFYEDEPIESRLQPGAEGYVIIEQGERVWGVYRRWLPIPWRKWKPTVYPVTVKDAGRTDSQTYSVTFTPDEKPD